MKFKTMILCCLAAVVLLSIGYNHNLAKAKPEKQSATLSPIGVVSVQRVFLDCKRNAQHREHTNTELKKVETQLKKLAEEIETQTDGLKALKGESQEYLTAAKKIMTKRANLQAQQEFYKQQFELKDQRWIEKLYKEILQITGKVAAEKGLALVLEKNEPDLPAINSNELMMTIRTHKVLYSAGCEDITKEVLAMIDGPQ